jgi:hypothetical protein
MSSNKGLLEPLLNIYRTPKHIKKTDGRYSLKFQKKNPEKTYNEILNAIGIGEKLLKPDFKDQIISMFRYETFSKHVQFNQAFWEAPNLNIWSLNMAISMNDKEEDRVSVDLTYCFVLIDLDQEWHWNRVSKCKECRTLVQQRLEQLLKGKDDDHLKGFIIFTR